MISRHFAPEEIGSGPVVSEIVKAFSKVIGRPLVIASYPFYPDSNSFDLINVTQIDAEMEGICDVVRVTIGSRTGKGFFGRVIAELGFALGSAWQALFRKRFEYVVSICPSLFSLMVGRIACINAYHIGFVHDIPSDLTSFVNPFVSRILKIPIKILERFCFNRCDGLVVLSNEMRDRLRSIGVVRPIAVSFPYIDLSSLSPMTVEDLGHRTIVYSGNIGLKQGVGVLLEVADNLLRLNPKITLIIRGAGSQKMALQNEVASRALSNVIIEDLVPRAAYVESLCKADIHIVPQIDQGADAAVPSKLYSIITAGRAFIALAPKDGAIARLAGSSGAGLVFDYGEPRLAAEACCALIADSASRHLMERSGREYALRHFSTYVGIADAFACIFEEGKDERAASLSNAFRRYSQF